MPPPSKLPRLFYPLHYHVKLINKDERGGGGGGAPAEKLVEPTKGHSREQSETMTTLWVATTQALSVKPRLLTIYFLKGRQEREKNRLTSTSNNKQDELNGLTSAAKL